MKKKIVALLCVITTFFATACLGACSDKTGSGSESDSQGASRPNTVESETRDPEKVYSVSFDYLGGKDVMPVGVWWGPYTPLYGTVNGNTLPDYVSDYYYKLLKESGVNFVTVAKDNYAQGGEVAKSVMKSLDLCKDNGLGYMVYDSFFKSYADSSVMAEKISGYLNHDACVGIHVLDEPTYAAIDSLAASYENYKTAGVEGKYPMINLLPKYAGEFKNVDYKDYLQKFLDTTDSAFLSYDSYWFRNGIEDCTTSGKAFYFTEMNDVKTVADENGVPFWVFIQAGGYFNDGDDRDGKGGEPYPNEACILWNVNMCLAYGAKCIQYFTFIQPYEYGFIEGDDYDNYKNMMLGAMGNTNQAYYYVQKANKQIAAIDHVLMNASNVGLIAKGEDAEKNILTGTLDSFRELKGVSDSDVVIGCFDYLGKTALYVVSNSVEKKQSVTLNFDNNYAYDVIQRATNAEVLGENITLTLEKGEGVLVVLK